MSDFDFAGSLNAPDAGGAGAPMLPPVRSLPSVAAPDAQPPSIAPGGGEDPRLAAVLQSLQPKQTPPWQEALQKVLPIIGAMVAMHNNAGSAFTQTYAGLDKQREQEENQKALETQRLAGVLHQQQMERHQANMERVAAKAIEAKARKEDATKTDKLLRDEWTAQSQGGLIDTINNMIQTRGPEAADEYMKSTHIGALTEQGLPHTVKDLVDRYAVKAPDGTLIGGKGKTTKEAKAGTQEDWVQMAEEIEEGKRGRSLTTEERRTVDAAAIGQYKNLSKDPDTVELTRATKKMQLTLDSLRADQLKTQINEMNEAKGDIKEGTKEFGLSRDLAYGILSYGDFARMYAFQRSGREQMRKIYDKARELNPDFSPALFEQGARFAGSPQTKRSMAAITNVESGIPSMIDASNAAARTGVKSINEHFVIPGGVQFGDKAYSDLQAAHKAFADELSLALGVGTASDLKTKLGLDIADPSLPPDKFESVLKTQVLPFLLRRRASMKSEMGPYGAKSASEMLPGAAQPGTAIPGARGYTYVVREQ